jgi:hypothetical protein
MIYTLCFTVYPNFSHCVYGDTVSNVKLHTKKIVTDNIILSRGIANFTVRRRLPREVTSFYVAWDNANFLAEFTSYGDKWNPIICGRVCTMVVFYFLSSVSFKEYISNWGT